MKNRIVSLLLAFCLLLSLVTVTVSASDDIITTPTGYTKASDVVYKTSYGYIANWGARGEDCVFLSTYAEAFYTGSYTYEILSQKEGGTSQSNAPSSALYSALKSMMKAAHSHETSYNETRDLYCYTDCLRNDTAHISSFYSGKELSGKWDSGKTWNREHTWPNSKGMNGNDENDIMMLRPTWVQENSSRGNTAYGEGSKYFDPGEAVRGDCARIVLYVYTRWGNTGKMWGESGVMESLDILLKWMEEDPVDTWEMGRNDAVQSITGTRNVFVDYPEYAWLLFGKEIPSDMVTPSGKASGGTSCAHEETYTLTTDATCVSTGKTETYCSACNKLLSTQTIDALGHDYVITTVAPTCSAKGYNLYDCTRCTSEFKTDYTDVVDHKDDDGDLLCDFCGDAMPYECAHEKTYDVIYEPTCTADGKIETYCKECDTLLATEFLNATGHDYVITTVEPTCTDKGYDVYQCSRCEDNYKKNYVSALGHDFVTTTVAPTCEEMGYDYHVCSRCSAEYKNNYTEEVGHIDEDDDNACDRCGEQINPPAPPAHDCPCENYIDITPEAWYHDYTVYAIENGLMNGISADRFDPSGCVTRAMLVTIMYRIEGEPSVEDMSHPFTDVESNQWYTDAVTWAANNGIVNGMTATTYEPNTYISREQIATILYRYAISKGEDVTLSTDDALSIFPDGNEISAYAVDALTWAVDRGLINGISGTLSAQALAIRAQLATILMRYLEAD